MPHESDADWKACRPGEIDELAKRMRRRQRRPIVAQAAAVCAGLILVAGTVLFLGRAADTPEDSHRYGGIHCAEVRQYARAGRLAQLEPGLRRKIDIHRQHCPACDRLLREMQEMQQSHRPPAGAHMVFQRRLPESDCGRGASSAV
jgi:hypothetical protein